MAKYFYCLQLACPWLFSFLDTPFSPSLAFKNVAGLLPVLVVAGISVKSTFADHYWNGGFLYSYSDAAKLTRNNLIYIIYYMP